MTLVFLSGPTAEPLTLADAKSWVKVTDGADDALLQSLITSARIAVEAATGRLLITQQWRVTLDAWPDGLIVNLPLAPVRSISRVRVVDASGAFRDVASTLFALDAGEGRARMVLSASPPAPASANNGIQIDLVAGYGDAATAVPEPLRLAMRHLIAFWYANRGDGELAQQVPAQVTALLALYRMRRLA